MGHPFPEFKKRTKPVTLIVGIICKDAIVLAADSQTTKGASKQLGTNKINIVEFANGKAAIAEAGSILSNVAIEALKNLAKGKQIENELTIAKTAEAAVREVLKGITMHLNPTSSDQDRQNFLQTDENYFELMIAYYFGNKPCLYTIRSPWCVPFPATSYFSTSGIASDLANYILKEHTERGMDKNLTYVIAIKTVKDAIDNVEGCGLPIRLAMIRKPFRQRPYRLEPTHPNQLGGIGVRVYGDVTIEPSWIQIFTPDHVEGITKIIANVEQNTKASRNKRVHEALKRQNNAYLKKANKQWEEMQKKYPEQAAETEARIAASMEVGQAFEILPDEE